MTAANRSSVDGLTNVELRMIKMPDGSRRPFTNPKWVWVEHDYVVDWFGEGPKRAEWIVRLAHEESERSGRPFGKLYPVLIQFVANAIRKRAPETATGMHGTA